MPEPADDVSTTLSPVQKLSGLVAEIVGGACALTVVTMVVSETAEQPATVTFTLYDQAVFAVNVLKTES